MKRFCKKMTAVLTTVAALALGVGAGTVGAMLFNNAIQDTSNKKQDSNDSSAPVTTSQNSDGTMSASINGCVFGKSLMNAASLVNSTKTLSFTLEPSDVSDKKIDVVSSNPDLVSVSSSKINSGDSVTLTLKDTFTDTVTITGTSEIDSSVKKDVTVSVYNYINRLVPYKIASDTSSKDVLSIDTSSAIETTGITDSYSFASYTPVLNSQSGKTIWHSATPSGASSAEDLEVYFYAIGMNSDAVAPTAKDVGSLKYCSTGTYNGKDCQCYKYHLSGDSTDETIDLPIENADFKLDASKYVAPSEMTSTADSSGDSINF